MQEEKKRTYSAPALEKGLEVLELLAETKLPMSLIQISTSLGRSKNELYRMLTVLETLGYLHKKDGAEAYSLTNKLFEQGMKVSPIGTLTEAAFPTMHELALSIMQSCHIAVQNQEKMVVIARVESPSNVGMSVRAGHIMDLYKSASGLLFLSFLAEPKLQSLFLIYKNTSVDFDEALCRKQIEQIKTKEHACIPSPITDCIVDLSYPIYLTGTKEIIGALTVPYLQGTNAILSIEEAEQQILTASQSLTAVSRHHAIF